MRTLSAYICLLSGVGLCTASFALNEAHVIDTSVLFYFGECLLYAGGIFNVRLFVLKTIRDLLNNDATAKKGR